MTDLKPTKMTKKQAIQDLKDYFRLTERRRAILAAQIMCNETYEYKVKEANDLLSRINLLAFGLEKYPLETIH